MDLQDQLSEIITTRIRGGFENDASTEEVGGLKNVLKMVTFSRFETADRGWERGVKSRKLC